MDVIEGCDGRDVSSWRHWADRHGRGGGKGSLSVGVRDQRQKQSRAPKTDE
jgi:hypothetical protein